MSRYPRPSEKLGEPIINVKIWVDDDSFESTFSIPVSATPEQINSFTKSWLGTLAEVIKLPAPRPEGTQGQ